MQFSDWLAVVLLGVGAVMSTQRKNLIRIFGILSILIGLGGSIYQHKSIFLEVIGSDNTLVDVAVPAAMGSGNTFVSSSQLKGNAVYNKGGTAIGNGACADSSSIAIGAGATAGKCTKKSNP